MHLQEALHVCIGRKKRNLAFLLYNHHDWVLIAAESQSEWLSAVPKVASCPRSYGLPRSEELRKEGGGETSSISLRTSSRADRTTSLARLITLTNHQPAPNSFCVSWHWNFEKPSCIHNYDCSFSRPPLFRRWSWGCWQRGFCTRLGIFSEGVLPAVMEQRCAKNAISSWCAFKILCLINRQPWVSRARKRIQSCTLIPATAVERRPGER